MLDSCTFCRIIRGDAEGTIVFEDDTSVAFLDRRPLFPGHCLLVPRDHIETIADLPRELVEPFFSNVQLLARSVERAVHAEGIFLGINNRISQSVPHLHVHVVPRSRGDGLRGFFWPRNPYRNEREMIAVRDAIRRAVEELR